MLFSLGSPLANGTDQLFPGTQPQAFQEERSGAFGCLVSWGGAGTNGLCSWLVKFLAFWILSAKLGAKDQLKYVNTDFSKGQRDVCLVFIFSLGILPEVSL